MDTTIEHFSQASGLDTKRQKSQVNILIYKMIKLIIALSSFGLRKAIADGPAGQVLAGPLFLKVRIKLHFTKSKQ